VNWFGLCSNQEGKAFFPNVVGDEPQRATNDFREGSEEERSVFGYGKKKNNLRYAIHLDLINQNES
jgi:hypothetical protein